MKRLTTTLLVLSLGCTAFAGGLMTNTNYHIAFDRMMARGTTFDIDAVYSNPAGLAWTREGWTASFNWQIPTQHRDIETTVYGPIFHNGQFHKKYEGKASAPFVPGIFATYRKGKFAIGAMLGIVGSGGYVKYNEGVPMFTVPLIAMLATVPDPYNAGQTFTPNKYSINANMKGKQYIYGAQLNATYRITDWLSASLGLRVSLYDGYYRGYVRANNNANGANLVGLSLDCDQKAVGWAPIVALAFHKKNLTVSAKYEFRTKVNTKNTTNELMVNGNDVRTAEGKMAMSQQLIGMGLDPTNVSKLGTMTSAYEDGARTRYDMPAMLSVAVGYEILPKKLRATLEYHFFDDKHAKMANDRQEHLQRGTHELLAGVEWDINKTFTVSAGAQRTDYGLSDDYQSHTSFACDSWSVGFGGAVNINKHLRMNAGYFVTLYSDYTKSTLTYQGTPLPGTDTFSRTNGVIGIGIDYKF